MDWRAISHEACFKVIDDTGIRYTTLQRRVSGGMATAAGGSTMTPLEAVSGVVRGALRGVLAPGGDPLLGAKAIMMGVIAGAGIKKGPALRVLAQTTRAMIRQAAHGKGDLGSVVSGLLRGAIAGSERMDVSAANAAEAVVGVAIEEVYRIGSSREIPARAAVGNWAGPMIDLRSFDAPLAPLVRASGASRGILFDSAALRPR
jgi:hypothetical protein